MSVLKNKRSVSKYEYENSFNIMYQYFKIQLSKTPIRRQKWIYPELTEILRDVHMSIMELSTGYKDYKERDEWRYNLIKYSLKRLQDFQNPLCSYWAIMKTDEKHRITWCEHINKEIALLKGMLKSNPCYNEGDELGIKLIMYYKNSDVKNAKFLSNMKELLEFSHSKIIHAKKEFDGFESASIIELVGDAWYYCLSANRKIPENAEEYKERKENISNAISCLHKLNRPMLSLFIMVGYSEHVMREWSDLLTKELKLLSSLQKSDKKRFGSLK